METEDSIYIQSWQNPQRPVHVNYKKDISEEIVPCGVTSIVNQYTALLSAGERAELPWAFPTSDGELFFNNDSCLLSI